MFFMFLSSVSLLILYDHHTSDSSKSNINCKSLSKFVARQPTFECVSMTTSTCHAHNGSCRNNLRNKMLDLYGPNLPSSSFLSPGYISTRYRSSFDIPTPDVTKILWSLLTQHHLCTFVDAYYILCYNNSSLAR